MILYFQLHLDPSAQLVLDPKSDSFKRFQEEACSHISEKVNEISPEISRIEPADMSPLERLKLVKTVEAWETLLKSDLKSKFKTYCDDMIHPQMPEVAKGLSLEVEISPDRTITLSIKGSALWAPSKMIH